jgi:hypothetical protein
MIPGRYAGLLNHPRITKAIHVIIYLSKHSKTSPNKNWETITQFSIIHVLLISNTTRIMVSRYTRVESSNSTMMTKPVESCGWKVYQKHSNHNRTEKLPPRASIVRPMTPRTNNQKVSQTHSGAHTRLLHDVDAVQNQDCATQLSLLDPFEDNI